jgi:hypothetical protein
MDPLQRRTVALAAYAVAAVLFLFFFARPLWDWAAWDSARGTLDLGIMRVTTRPPFPNDPRSVIVGLVLPIVLAATGRVLHGSRPPGR